MGKLAILPNIGVRLEEQLNVAGIDTPEQLRELGSRKIWMRLKRMDPAVNLTRLYALEGAVRGVRWHLLDDDTKSELRDFAAEAERELYPPRNE